MSIINTQIKPFNATAYHNGEFKPVSDADLKGNWSVVFFYPADFTFVCPTEILAFQEKIQEFEKRNVAVIGCSTDSANAHWTWLKMEQKDSVSHDR